MTSSDDNPTQAPIIFNDEERPLLIKDIIEDNQPSERREALAILLIQLREHLSEAGWPLVSRELHLLLEETFKGSETYALALELYEQRFSLRGSDRPAEVLRMVLDEQLSPTPRSDQGWPVPVLTHQGSRFSPEQYQKRLEVAGVAILGTTPQRIDCMHGCLKADAATLARILSILEET
ncbi:MAG: hypothetical protein V7641_1629 [Blastocatellia bacterium]